MKRFFNYLRYQYYISLVTRYVFWPLMRLCEAVANQIKMKVWVNGGNVNYDGVTIKFPKNVGVNYSSNIFWIGVRGYEPDTWQVIKHFLHESTVFIDVGSNIGIYSILARKIRPDLTILSYEPVPSIFKKSIALHNSNGCSIENVFNIAIGEENGTAEIFLPIVQESIEEQTTATLRVDSWQRTKNCEKYQVTVMKLDNLLSEFNSGERVLIKIDVEDFESSVFKGAIGLMQTVKPVFICEILPRDHGNQETFDNFNVNGYVAFGISSVGLIRFNKGDFIGNRLFTDFLIIPESMALPVNYLHYASLTSLKWKFA